MAMPVTIWLALICFASVTTGYSLFVKDKNNYSDAIAGLVAMIFWFVAGIAILGGVATDTMVYSSGVLMWLFIAIGVIVAIITIVKIIDIATERKYKGEHVQMGKIQL